MFDLVTVGHFSIDLIRLPATASPKTMLGGPPTYVSLAARKLDAKVSVISKVGEDFPNNHVVWLLENGVDLSGLKRVKEAVTTSFILKYKNSTRWLKLRSRAPPISPEDFQSFAEARAVHIAPIANEVPETVVEKMRELTEILSLDPQGFVREFDAKGNVRLKRRLDMRILENVDIYKSSQNEIKATTGSASLHSAVRRVQDYGVKIVIVTMGIRGLILSLENAFYKLPACKPHVVIDPTGAGDALIGAFLAEYIRGKDPVWCACVGSASASFVVEGLGPSIFGEKEEVYARAMEIYEKGIKQKAM